MHALKFFREKLNSNKKVKELISGVPLILNKSLYI